MKITDLRAPAGARVDIVVRAKNGHEMTRASVDSIISNTPEGQYRLILVDDGSEPRIDEDACDFVVRCEASHGAVTATNLGVAIALTRTDSAYVLVMDNDPRVPDGDDGWLGRMVAEIEKYGPRTAAVGATTNFANPPAHPDGADHVHARLERRAAAGSKENPPVAAFVSFCVLLRKDALRRCGPWDERYNPGNYEDTDYSVALRDAGYEIRVARSVYIHHDGHQTFREDLGRLVRENGAKFAAKWGGSPKEQLIIRRAIEQGGLEEIDTILAAIHTTGALAYTFGKAREEALLAIAALTRLPKSTFRDALVELAESSVERRY